MTPELEVLDQLEGGDLPLDVIAGLFPDPDHCRTAIAALLRSGKVRILDTTEQAIPLWRYEELERTSDIWAKGTPYRLSLHAA